MSKFLRSLGVLLAWLLLTAGAPAQSTSRWKVPDPVLRIDLGPDNQDRQVVLEKEGLSLAIASRFFMIGRAQVTIEVALPESGRFELKLVNDKALVELRNVRREGKRGLADIVSRVPPLSVTDALDQTRAPIDAIQAPVRQRVGEKAKSLSRRELHDYLEARGEKLPGGDENKMREAYVQAKADEETAESFKAKIAELIKPRPEWYHRDIDERLQQANANPRRIYHELAAVQLADEYLQRFGFQSLQRQTRYADYADRVKGRLDAVYQVVSGKAAQSAKRAVDTGEAARLREALLVDLDCRLHAEADPQDPNSQWFNGQRIVCQAAGIKTIKVTGRLDPARHDQADWWILDKYGSAVTLEAPAASGYRVETPLKADAKTVLRVVATEEKPVEYSFELRLTAKDRGMELLIFESPERVDNRFPF
ncbi:MAG TPA: hypothetical protein VG826_23320 [Pirellulales bacterium]|nr:hypothetical protein [Pirellulales bacterium]